MYGMLRVLVDRLALADLDDLAEVHDGDAVGDLPDHRQVVRDEDVGQVEVTLQVAQQVEDLRLDRHVERGDRLVADDQLRRQRERARDADALALAARELVRVAVVVLRAQPDRLEQLLHARLRALLPVDRERRRRRSGRPSCAGSATSTGPGRSSASRGAAGAARAAELRDVACRRNGSCRTSGRAGAASAAPSSTCRSPTRRRCRASRRGARSG